MKKLILPFLILLVLNACKEETTEPVVLPVPYMEKAIHLTAPNTLHTALSAEELNSVTDLTITGKIDARDFKTIRDKMPNLSVVILNIDSVTAYSGTEGTAGTEIYSYSKNTIPKKAFYDRSNITSITIPSCIVKIDDNAFKGCSALDSITIPNVSYLGTYAFLGCSSLTTINIPSTVTTIGSFAFSQCTGLTSIYSYRNAPIALGTLSLIFYQVNKATCTLYVPAGSIGSYSTADQWKDFLNIEGI